MIPTIEIIEYPYKVLILGTDQYKPVREAKIVDLPDDFSPGIYELYPKGTGRWISEEDIDTLNDKIAGGELLNGQDLFDAGLGKEPDPLKS